MYISNTMEEVSEVIRILSARAAHRAAELLCKDPYADVYIYGVKENLSDFMVPIAVNTDENNIGHDSDIVKLLVKGNIKPNLTIEQVYSVIHEAMRQNPVLPYAETSEKQDKMITDYYDEVRSIGDADWQIKMDDVVLSITVPDSGISI